MRAGLLSGVFDPIHMGHINCAQQAARLFKLDRVYFAPTAVSPHKKRCGASAFDRYAMTQIALLGKPRFYVSGIEMGVGVSYTVDTIKRFKKKFKGGLYFIMGLDAFADTHNWKSAASLLRGSNFIVISRPGLKLDETVAGLEKKLRAKQKSVSFSATGVSPCGYALKLSGSRYSIHLCTARQMDVSSTAIRQKIHAGKSIKYLVPKAVEQYIMKVELYRR
ncbi:MAG: nicotinate-nucleotide adenylyltransferase [Nitrospinota bacterium]